MKAIFFPILFFSLVGLSKTKTCEYSSEGIRKAYDQILHLYPSKRAIQPFECLLEIHKNGSGLLKILAADTLRPLLGGKPLAGRDSEPKAQAVAQLLNKVALHSVDVVHDSFLDDYSQGAWTFYDLFCQPKWQEQCTVFLPDENQIKKESELIGSSSMMILRSAYLTLKGKDQQFVADRIKNLYFQTSNEDSLKRKVIEQIYNELFGAKLSLELS